MFLKKLLRRVRPRRPLRIAAGTTAQFPVISHTFVYQELTALHEMLGAEVKVFHSQHGDPAAMHAAFRYLDEHRTWFETSWERHTEDWDHYRAARPGKFESLLEALTEASGMPREELEQSYELRLAFTNTRLIEEWGADYVHTYFFYDQALNGLVASWLLDIPRGLSTYADHMMDDWPLKVVPLHLRTASVIVATSRRIAGELVAIGGEAVRDKIVVKPNGVDGRRFPMCARRPIVDRPIELVCISRIEPKKGMVELADTVKALVDRDVDVRVHVIGSADSGNEVSERYAAAVEDRIREHGIGDALILHGAMKQEEMAPHLERADAFVAPFVETESGDKDGIPTAILEGMSTGLPIVATDAGSITEIVDDGVEGFIVPQREPEALAAAIARLAAEPELAVRMGAVARARFEREFDIHATEPRLHARVVQAVRRRPAAMR